MSAFATLLRLMWRDQRTALWRGAALSVLVLLMGAALLGLSGWFITAAAAAGLAGAGAVFDVFRPSAMVRFLALGRTGARYGERVLTHDATLRALASLRVRLLHGLVGAPWEVLTRLRGAQSLNRLTADVDALDGIPLRFVLPVLAGLLTHAVVFFALWTLVGLSVALVVVLGFVVGGGAVLVLGIIAARRRSRLAETAAQTHRTRLIDLIRARADLTVYGQLPGQVTAVARAEARRHAEATGLDRIERRSGVVLSMIGTVVAALALWLGADMALSGTITPAKAAIGVFVALALMETIAPLRRTLAEQGRMVQAARRVVGMLGPGKNTEGASVNGVTLSMEAVRFSRAAGGRAILDAFDLKMEPGETVALAGPSGSGKSTVLLLAAGLVPPDAGRVTLGDVDLSDLAEDSLRDAVTLVPQRASLLQGSVADNLRLADPTAEDAVLWKALEAACLADVILERGGLEAQLGPRGSGLSGGEARRLILARAVLRKPRLLLLDEPTEGLHSELASRVLSGLRAAMPQAGILMAAHRPEELAFAGRVITITRD